MKMKIKFKKSQMEILGLAIVVVLVLIATIFVVRFMVVKAPADYRKSFISAQLATNMLNSFLKTSAKDCSLLTMTELLQDCAQAKSITCDNEQDSCQYVEATAAAIFSKTLSKWKVKYRFLAYIDQQTPLIQAGTSCPGGQRSKPFPIPITGETMYTQLDICT